MNEFDPKKEIVDDISNFWRRGVCELIDSLTARLKEMHKLDSLDVQNYLGFLTNDEGEVTEKEIPYNLRTTLSQEHGWTCGKCFLYMQSTLDACYRCGVTFGMMTCESCNPRCD